MSADALDLAVAFGVALTVFFVLMAVLWKGDDPIRSRVESMRRGRQQREAPDLTLPFADRVLAPTLDATADRILAVLPGNVQKSIQHKLVLAGEPMTLAGFMMVTGGAVGLFVLLGVSLLVAAGSAFESRQLLVVVALALVGAVLPYFWLSGRVKARQNTIVRSLPDSFDLITTCVEAGLGLDASLARVAEKIEGPFADELSQTLREIGLGRQRRDALAELGERTGVPDLITFVNAIIQAEQMGTSVGQVLRVQADQMRVRRRQRAEDLSHQAPVKMVFPLVLCIFPTLFLVILGPAGISIYENLVK